MYILKEKDISKAWKLEKKKVYSTSHILLTFQSNMPWCNSTPWQLCETFRVKEFFPWKRKTLIILTQTISRRSAMKWKTLIRITWFFRWKCSPCEWPLVLLHCCSARFLIMEGSKCTKGSNSKIDKNVTCLLSSIVVPYVLPNYLDGSKNEDRDGYDKLCKSY